MMTEENLKIGMCKRVARRVRNREVDWWAVEELIEWVVEGKEDFVVL